MSDNKDLESHTSLKSKIELVVRRYNYRGLFRKILVIKKIMSRIRKKLLSIIKLKLIQSLKAFIWVF